MSYLSERSWPIIVPNPDFENVAAGGRALARIPVGSTYLESLLNCTVDDAAATRAQIESDIEYVRILVNAKEKWHLTGTQLVALAEFWRTGSVGDRGIIPFFYRRSWMQLLDNQQGPQYGTADVDSMAMEVKLAAGADINGLKLSHRQIGPSNLGTHQTLLSENRPYAAIGTQQIFDLPRDPRTRLQGIHIQTDPTKVSRIVLKADNFTEVDTTVEELAEFYRLETSPRTPQVGFVHLDFTARNLYGDSIKMTMNRLELAVTYSEAPGNVPIILDLATPSDTKAAQANGG